MSASGHSQQGNGSAGRRETGQARLLSDVLAGDMPDRELLIRFVRSPNSLSAAEREEVERLLAENPRYADRLRVLQSFRASQAGEPSASEGAGSSPAPALRGPRRSLRSVRSQAIGFAAAAAVLLAVFFGVRRDSSVEPAPGVQVADQTVPVPPQGPVAVAPEPTPAPEPEPALPPVAEVPPVAAPVAPTPAPKPAAKPAPKPASGIEVAEGTRPTRKPAAAPEEPKPASGPSEPSQSEDVLVAMADLDYEAPADAAARPRVASTLRGASISTSLTALVPEHVGLTAQAQPTLYWHIDTLPDPALHFTFTLTDEASLETLVQEELPRPARPGLQRIDLRDFGVNLKVGSEYRWSVLLRPDPRQRALDRLAQGWLRRVDAAPLPAGTGTADAIAQEAEQGLWYDALADVAGVVQRQPDNESARRALRQLLAKAGLGSLEP